MKRLKAVFIINFLIFILFSCLLFFCIKSTGLCFLLSSFFLLAVFLNTFWILKVSRSFKNIVEVARKENFSKTENTFLSSFSEKVKREIREIIDQKNENEEILDSLIEGVIAFNKDNSITYVNLMAEKMLQESKKNLISKNLKELKMPSNFIKNCESLALSSQEQMRVLKESIFLEGKSKIFLDCIAIPKKQNGGALLILQDRTSDYKMLQMGKDFIANASHELKTPLTIIRGFAETLEDLELDPQTVKEIMQKIKKTSERLERIIYDLLKLAKVENLEQKHFIKCNLKQIVINCREMILQEHKKASIEFSSSKEDFFILGEEGLLELAIRNLLENAIKYSKNEIIIKISLKKEDDKTFLAIEDQGIGIAETDLPFIFDRFFTINKNKKGTGLGLAIVKNIVEKHYGEIKVLSEIEKGSTFELIFPAS